VNEMVKRRKKAFIVLKYGIVTGLCFIMMYPLLWMLSSSFKEEFYIFKEVGLWPAHFTLDNYILGWQGGSGGSFGRYFANTLLLVAAVMLCNVVSCSITAFPFSRMNFRFRGVLFALVLFTMMMPNHVLIVPRYVIFHNLGWVDTYKPMIMPKLLATEGFFVYLIIQFMKGIPAELDQAAIVDGCGWFRIYLYVALPLSLPALATVSIFSFIWTWNDFLTQLIYISTPAKKTISLALRGFIDLTSQSAYGQLFAMSILSLVPVLVFFVAFQKYIIEGIATSGMKG